MQGPSALVIGGVSWDTVVRLGALPQPQPQTLFARASWDGVGSTGAGKALNLRQLGWRVTLHTLLGDDAPGALARAALEAGGVRLLSQTDALGTERHLNLVADGGERVSIYTHCGSVEPAVDVPALLREAAPHDAVVVNILPYARQLLRPLREAGHTIWIDLHDWDGQQAHHRNFADAADWIFLSSDRLAEPRALMQALAAQRVRRLIVCTHGERGATALAADGRWLEVPAEPVAEVVDCNGAGDAFMAGVMHGVHAGRTIEDALRLGARLGASCVATRGLAAGPVDLPWLAGVAAPP